MRLCLYWQALILRSRGESVRFELQSPYEMALLAHLGLFIIELIRNPAIELMMQLL